MASSMLETKILPSPIRPGLCGAADRIDRPLDQFVADHDLDFDLGQKVDDVFRAAIEFGVSLLPSETLGLGHRDTLKPDLLKRFLDLVELERLDDGFDLLHRAPPGHSKFNCYVVISLRRMHGLLIDKVDLWAGPERGKPRFFQAIKHDEPKRLPRKQALCQVRSGLINGMLSGD